MYNLPSPGQSTTSLSDNEDDYGNKSTFFSASDPVVLEPARWSARHSLIFTPSSASSQPDAADSPIALLPTELLIHVLRHLHSTRDLYHALLVSRAWCESSVELLWHKPSIASTATLLKMIRVLGSDESAFAYARFVRRLNFLYLGPDLTDGLFSRVAQCARLERLTLVNCKSLTDDVLARVLHCFPNLVALDLTGVSQTSDQAVLAMAASSKRLQGINLGGCKRVTDKGVLALAANCPLLRRVKLSGVERLTNRAVSALAQGCPLLLEIDLNNCRRISDKSVRDLWEHSFHMREMRLSHAEELTDLGFPAPARVAANHVSLGQIPSTASMLPAIARLYDEPAPLQLNRRFEHLRMLDLTACSLLTDDAVEGIIASAPKIRNLVLARCSQITDNSVESICHLGKHLHYLHLGHCSSITDSSVKNLARACTRLRYIDFANCALLTDMSVFELSGLPKLRRIGLVRVSNLTDEAIYSLADRHATLERIHLSYCQRITVMSIHFLLQKLPKLTHLSLTGIPAFRRVDFQKFCRPPPPEFNSSQRASFCVYSGTGVSDLRDHLIELFNNITDEFQGADDTDYDDQEEYDEDYPPADAEADVELDGLEGEDDEDQDAVHQPAFSSRLPSDPSQSAPHTMTRGHVMLRVPRHGPSSRSLPVHFSPHAVFVQGSSAGAGPSHLPHHQPGVGAHGPAPVGAAAAPIPSGSIPASFVFRRPPPRGFADAPIVESQTPPPHVLSDAVSVASNGSGHTQPQPELHHRTHAMPLQPPLSATQAQAGANFFLTYPDRTAALPSPRNGVLTPDLVFAEIGHGRGAETGTQPYPGPPIGYSLGGLILPDGSTLPPTPFPLASPTEAVYGASPPSTAPVPTASNVQQQQQQQSMSGPSQDGRSAWAHVHREPSSPLISDFRPTLASAGPSRAVGHAQRGALATPHAGPGSVLKRPESDPSSSRTSIASNPAPTPADNGATGEVGRSSMDARESEANRGRNVRRGIRNATSFFFNRGSSHGSHPESAGSHGH